MRKVILALVVGGIIVGLYFLINNYLNSSQPSLANDQNIAANLQNNQPINPPAGEQQQANTPTAAQNNSQTTTQAGSYIAYSPQAVQQAAAQGKKPVLFFHADWCPTCRAADKDINKKLDQIPEDIVILKTDYDKETELKEKYGITYQHTFVQVDGQGNEITKWNGGALEAVIDRVK